MFICLWSNSGPRDVEKDNLERRRSWNKSSFWSKYNLLPRDIDKMIVRKYTIKYRTFHKMSGTWSKKRGTRETRHWSHNSKGKNVWSLSSDTLPFTDRLPVYYSIISFSILSSTRILTVKWRIEDNNMTKKRPETDLTDTFWRLWVSSYQNNYYLVMYIFLRHCYHIKQHLLTVTWKFYLCTNHISFFSNICLYNFDDT